MTQPKSSIPKHEHPHEHEPHEHPVATYEHSHAHNHEDLGEAIERVNDRITSTRSETADRFLEVIGDHRLYLVNAVRALIRVFEVGVTNSEQARAIHHVKVAIGDAKGTGCPHELRVYEKGDRLICQSCRMDVTNQFAA